MAFTSPHPQVAAWRCSRLSTEEIEAEGAAAEQAAVEASLKQAAVAEATQAEALVQSEAKAAKESKQQRLREQFKGAIYKVIALVRSRLEVLELKGKSVECPAVAPTELLTELHTSLRELDDQYDASYSLMLQLKKMPKLFVLLSDSVHTFDSTYMLSMQDCEDTDCQFGCRGWTGVPAKELLRCRPVLPMLNPSMPGHMYSYDEAKALPGGTSECDLPSKKNLSKVDNVGRKEKDKEKELHPSKVRAVCCCDECGRPRCIFSKTKPSEAQLRKLTAYLEGVNYVCGDNLFPESVEGNDKKLADVFYNTEAITCRNDMELCYFNYGGLRGREEFEHVCARCGNAPEESPLVDLKQLSAQVTKGKVPLPLCVACVDAEKTPVLVGRSNRVTEELGRKERKAEQRCEVNKQKTLKKAAQVKGHAGKVEAAKAAADAAKAAAATSKKKAHWSQNGVGIQSFFSRTDGVGAGAGSEGASATGVGAGASSVSADVSGVGTGADRVSGKRRMMSGTGTAPHCTAPQCIALVEAEA